MEDRVKEAQLNEAAQDAVSVERLAAAYERLAQAISLAETALEKLSGAHFVEVEIVGELAHCRVHPVVNHEANNLPQDRLIESVKAGLK